MALIKERALLGSSFYSLSPGANQSLVKWTKKGEQLTLEQKTEIFRFKQLIGDYTRIV